MKTDIQIAQDASLLHIREIAAAYGIDEDDLELYGRYKAKLSDDLIARTKDQKTESSYLSLPSIPRLPVKERLPQA